MSIEREDSNITTDLSDILQQENPILNLTDEQVREIEQRFQATFYYKPGLIGSILIPSQDEGENINSIRVRNFPHLDSDYIPQNRAIAEIGVVKEYWKLYEKALLSGQINFFSQIEFSLLPLLQTEEGELFVNKLPNAEFIRTVEKANPQKDKYNERIYIINYAGDGDFTGNPISPRKYIKVKYKDTFMTVPHKEIGVSDESARRIFNADNEINRSKRKEITNIILEGLSSFDDAIRELIIKTHNNNSTVGDFEMAYTWLKILRRPYYDDKVLDYALKTVGEFVNKRCAEHIEESSTLKAVHNMVMALEDMYQEARPYYKK